MVFVKVKSFVTEEEVILACEALTRQGVHSTYQRNGTSFQLKVKDQQRETAINLIENSPTIKNYNYYKKQTI